MAQVCEGYEISNLAGRASFGLNDSLCFDPSYGTYLSCGKPIYAPCPEGGLSWNTYTTASGAPSSYNAGTAGCGNEEA